ncbi:LrgB family protein [Humitalea sp. 24SJ18S-53]|uniref:LrgB family protein n=1 Tax=Humitalea sp. 24SJ18S-53 TaxID=3422307 RepID=UPI003D6724BB
MEDLAQIWVYLAQEPLAALTVTLLAWLVAVRLAGAARWHPIANPTLIAVLLLSALLLGGGVAYAAYFAGAQFVHFLLGPATVALAVPLYRQWEAVRRSAIAVLASVLCGGVFAAVAGVAIAAVLGAPANVLATLAPRSVTMPVAMGIAERLGGLPSLTAVVVMGSGILGAALGPLLLTLLRVKDWRARGLAMGVAAHGIGTARALRVNEVAGAFAGLAMGLNALASAMLLPLLWRLVWG